MVGEIHEATGDEAAAWRDGWQERLTAGYGESRARGRLDYRAGSPDSAVGTIVAGGEPVGYVAVALTTDGRPYGLIDDVWVAPPHRRRGHGTAGRRWAETWLRSRALTWARALIIAADPAPAALFGGYRLVSQRMLASVGDPPPVTGRPMTLAEYVTWRRADVADYAETIIRAGETPDRAAELAERSFDELLTDGLETPGHSLSVLLAGDRPVAWIWVAHGLPGGRSFVYSVTVDEAERGKGYGRAVMRLGERRARDAGDTSLELNVFGHNRVAINLYDSLGYQATDQTRDLALH